VPEGGSVTGRLLANTAGDKSPRWMDGSGSHTRGADEKSSISSGSVIKARARSGWQTGGRQLSRSLALAMAVRRARWAILGGQLDVLFRTWCHAQPAWNLAVLAFGSPSHIARHPSSAVRLAALSGGVCLGSARHLGAAGGGPDGECRAPSLSLLPMSRPNNRRTRPDRRERGGEARRAAELWPLSAVAGGP
jgi:hypothetical protein